MPTALSCSHRCPVSQNQSQKSLLYATHLHPLLQHWQKWVGIMLCHLQMKPQKMWMKRMSLVIAGVSCLFQMHSLVRGIKLFIALGLSRLMPQMGKYISSSVTHNAVLCRKKLILLYLNITHLPEAWNHLFSVFLNLQRYSSPLCIFLQVEVVRALCQKLYWICPLMVSNRASPLLSLRFFIIKSICCCCLNSLEFRYFCTDMVTQCKCWD